MKGNHAKYRNIKFVIFILSYFIVFAGYAQKGTGEVNGVSRQGLNPEFLKMKGTIEKIESGPCKYTTGRSIAGTHLMVQTQDQLINVHLGPTSEVSQLFSATEGDSISMTVFQTDRLPKDHYIAKEVEVNGKTTILRDDTLKPVWSGWGRNQKWRTGY